MTPPISAATLEPTALRIALGAYDYGEFDAGVPVLAGEIVENLFGAARPAGRKGAFALFKADDWLLGAATLPLAMTAGLETASRLLYENIFSATRGRHLARVWNYVPAINATGSGGLENYRVFCQGRSLAFERYYGLGFSARLPSASAVGCDSSVLTVIFAACTAPPCHVENPLQVPAYDYPGEHGPRAPSFARATIVSGPRNSTVFISGTAAIRGHATLASDRTDEQLDCTLENLAALSLACGLGPALDQNGRSFRHFKIYLRHAADQPAVAATLKKNLLRDADHVSYLHADICRASLLVEIEASLFGVSGLR
jgi:hypothetical protein